MYGYIDSNGNKGILSGILDIPQYTMAQYTALSVKPEYWICTDYDSSSVYGIDSANVKYGDTSVEDMLNATPLTITRTENTYVNASSISACKVNKVGKLLVAYFPLAVSGAITTDWVQIATISNWTCPYEVINQFPAQDSAHKEVSLRIDTNGKVYIYTQTDLSSAWVRTTVVAVSS